jgi:proton-translocating NADH-quinone oxidoreductase chain L
VEAQHSSLLLLIPLFPLIGATINAFFGKRIQDKLGVNAVHSIAIAMPAISCLISWVLFFQLLGLEPEKRAFFQVGWDWMNIGLADARFAFWLDPLSSMMTLIITTIGTLIHLYSVGYMHGEPAYWRFFCYLNLFVTMMLILVLGDNFLVMFIGWEGVGLASYLLIGFWYKDLANAASGMKAFIVNRFGDACFVIGLFILFWGMQGSWTVPAAEIGDPTKKVTPLPFRHDYFRDPQAAIEEAEIAKERRSPRPGHEWTPEAPAATLTFPRLAKIFEGEVERERMRLELAAKKKALEEERVAAAASLTDHEELVAHNRESLQVLEKEDYKIIAALAQFDRDRGRSSIAAKEIILPLVGPIPILFLVCVLFFLGATAKSAQIPFYVWLPDAMAGPTPVSALIHAATMVTAGVYMIARLNFLFILSPWACTVVGLVGAATALFAASMGLFQYDIKKVLAYSTVSQLGFMFIGVGTGAYWAGMFHLLTHACFKACLFLGSGSVILGCHHEQDMRRMGGLRKYMPSTHWTYLIACFAIAGAPGLAGFCSKDEILWKAFSGSATHGLLPFAHVAIWVMGLAAATLTAFYMFRSYFMTFSGEYRGNELPLKDPYPADTARAKALFFPGPARGPTPEMLAMIAEHAHHHPAHGSVHAHGTAHSAAHDAHGHDPHAHAAGVHVDAPAHDDAHGHAHHGGVPHESPWTMTLPLWALAIASVFIGLLLGFPAVFSHPLGLHWHPLLETWLEPVLAPGAAMLELYQTHRPSMSWLADEHTSHLFEYALAALSVLVAAIGGGTAWWLYNNNANPLPERLLENPASVVGERFAQPVRELHRLIYNKYFVDEAYYTVFVKGMAYVWNGLRNVDVYVVDGAVNAAAFIGKYFGFLQGAIDKYIVDGAVNLVADVVMAFGQQLRKLQTGQIRSYLLGAFGGALACVAIIAALL